MNLKKIIIVITIYIIISGISFSENILKVGYYDDYPLVFKNTEGEPSGFMIEIFDEIFKNKDYKIDYKYGQWHELLVQLETGEVDILLNIAKNEERDLIYDFNEEGVGVSWGFSYCK